MTRVVTAPQINAILNLVTSLSQDASEQMTILSYALAIAAKAMDIPMETVMEHVGSVMISDVPLVPLSEASTVDYKRKMT